LTAARGEAISFGDEARGERGPLTESTVVKVMPRYENVAHLMNISNSVGHVVVSILETA
jgi:hypothetical protein